MSLRWDETWHLIKRAGQSWIMAAYFPYGDKTFAQIKTTFLEDAEGVAKNSAHAMERGELKKAVGFPVELHHRDRAGAQIGRRRQPESRRGEP